MDEEENIRIRELWGKWVGFSAEQLWQQLFKVNLSLQQWAPALGQPWAQWSERKKWEIPNLLRAWALSVWFALEPRQGLGSFSCPVCAPFPSRASFPWTQGWSRGISTPNQVTLFKDKSFNLPLNVQRRETRTFHALQHWLSAGTETLLRLWKCFSKPAAASSQIIPP